MKKKSKFYLFTVGVLIFSFLLFEMALQVFSFCIPKVNLFLNHGVGGVPHHIPDPILGHRPNPQFLGHDDLGFRNELIPPRADMVVLGDSQSYGTGVLREDAWPQQLQKLARKNIYNMAFGGYGPAHSLILMNEVLKFKPKWLVEAFYSGNDLADSFELIYELGQLQHLRHPNRDLLEPWVKRGILPSREECIHTIEIHSKKNKIDSSTKANTNQKVVDFTSPVPKLTWKINIKSIRLLKTMGRLIFNYKYRFPKIYRRIRKIKLMFLGEKSATTWESIKSKAHRQEISFEIFENPKMNTILTPGYRLVALDFKDARIVEGLRIALEAVLEIDGISKQNNMKFSVLLIPTKEYVVRKEKEQKSNNEDSAYQRLIRNETLLWEITQTVLKKHGVTLIDASTALEKSMDFGNRPYFRSLDGHPSKEGHRALAQLVYGAIY